MKTVLQALEEHAVNNDLKSQEAKNGEYESHTEEVIQYNFTQAAAVLKVYN